MTNDEIAWVKELLEFDSPIDWNEVGASQIIQKLLDYVEVLEGNWAEMQVTHEFFMEHIANLESRVANISLCNENA